MPEALASVIVPAYNAEQFIGEALDSAFAQDYEPTEVIVVDDGSTDQTAQIARRYGVRLLQQPNGGAAAARNAGLAVAQGEYIAILDADDIWPSDRLTVMVTALERSAAEIVIGLSDIFTSPGELVPAHFPYGVKSPAPGHLTALMARRSVYELVGNYDEDLRHAEDVDWFMRAREAGAAVDTIERVVTRHRIHARNLTRDRATGQRDTLRVLRASIARRRGDATPPVDGARP